MPKGVLWSALDPNFTLAGFGRHRTYVGRLWQGQPDLQGASATRQARQCEHRPLTRASQIRPRPSGLVPQVGPRFVDRI